MALPESDFVHALLKFPFRTLISASQFDRTVPFTSASIRSYNPYPEPEYGLPSMKIVGLCPELLQNESHLSWMKEYLVNNSKADTSEIEESLERAKSLSWKGTEYEDFFPGEESCVSYHRDNFYHVEFPSSLLQNLQAIGWRRVDLEFKVSNSMQKGAVHILVVQKLRFLGALGSTKDELEQTGARCVEMVAK